MSKAPFSAITPWPLRIVEFPYYKFSSLTPSYLLNVTKFLAKICQFKFLVMVDKHFFVYNFFFCHLKLQILVYFLCKNCNPSPLRKKTPPPPSKNSDTVRLPFLKIWLEIQPLPPPPQQKGGAHDVSRSL